MSDLKFDTRGGQWGECRSCKETVVWITTRRGKKMPCNPDGTSHFASCPQAEEWRHGMRRHGEAEDE